MFVWQSIFLLLIYKESQFVSCLPKFSEEKEKIGLHGASQTSDVSSFIKTAHRITTIPRATTDTLNV